MKQKNTPGLIIRWTARILGTFLVVFTLFMGIGEMLEGMNRNAGSSTSSFTPLMIIIFIFWFFALAALVLAIWKEEWGGRISLACFGIMYILTMINPLTPDKGRVIYVFLIFIIPSVLYILSWRLNRDRNQDTNREES